MITTKQGTKIQLNTIEEAIADIKQGKVIIVVDDEDRENEGDFVAAAENITPEIINFMATHGRGLICTPITESRCKELQLEMMVGNNTDPMETAFTISIDLKGHGVTTGISAKDRAKTVKALVDPSIKPFDLSRPGHIFPLKAKDGGVLAGFEPAGLIVEIMNEDGTMARLGELAQVAKKFDLKLVSIEDLVAYRMEHDSLIEKEEDFTINTNFGPYRLRAYKQTTNDQVHIALTRGNWKNNEPVLVRMNSTLVNNDILGTLTSSVDKKLDDMFKVIENQGKGAMVFINQQSQSFNLINRLKTLKEVQKEDEIAKAPNIKMDARDFGIGAQILHDLGIHKIRLMSNTKQEKRVGMIGYGLEIIDYVGY